MKPPAPSTPQSRDIFGAEFNGTPSHHRVLKPPGGGSSDIFGTGTNAEPNARRIKNHLASSVFLSDEPSTGNQQISVTTPPTSATASSATTNSTAASGAMMTTMINETSVKKFTTVNNDSSSSFCRLFGPPSPPKSNLKSINKLQSNILPTEEKQEAEQQHVPEPNGNNEHVNGDTTDTRHDEPIVNGNSQPIMNGNNRTNGNGNGSQNSRRVPPGGFSSGLW